MISIFRIAAQEASTLEKLSLEDFLQNDITERQYWIDLESPTDEEVLKLENFLNFDIPTREEMSQLEASSRLYMEDGKIFTTVTLVSHAEGPCPEPSPVTLIFSKNFLLSLRYSDFLAFKTLHLNFHRRSETPTNPENIALLLFDEIIERLSDLIDKTQRILHENSRRTFAEVQARKKPPLHECLVNIGDQGDRISGLRESLLSLHRAFSFLFQQEHRFLAPSREHLKMLITDANTLLEHCNFVANKSSFLLDATLGMIDNEQAKTIKIFSVLAVIFLPPTMIASIYGMNFQFMPELAMKYGYPLALGAMLLSAVLPYMLFRWKGWL